MKKDFRLHLVIWNQRLLYNEKTTEEKANTEFCDRNSSILSVSIRNISLSGGFQSLCLYMALFYALQ